MHPLRNIEDLKADLGSNDREVALKAAGLLATAHGPEGQTALVEALSDLDTRHVAALGVHEGRVQAALQPLLQLIKDPSNFNTTGTLVFALESLDCGDIIEELFDIMFTQSYESHISASQILNEQTFAPSEETRKRILDKWDVIVQDPSVCPDFGSKQKDIDALIQRLLPSK